MEARERASTEIVTGSLSAIPGMLPSRRQKKVFPRVVIFFTSRADRDDQFTMGEGFKYIPCQDPIEVKLGEFSRCQLLVCVILVFA